MRVKGGVVYASLGFSPDNWRVSYRLSCSYYEFMLSPCKVDTPDPE